MFTLIRGSCLYAPENRGRQDILIAGDRIAMVADAIEVPTAFPVDAVDAVGKIATPGFIDLHVHTIGGGGEGGPATRVPEIQLTQITTAGVTTVVGVLGTDDVSRHPETLLAKTQSLEQEGITAYMMSGSYRFPDVVTVTGSLRKDIALIPHIVGVGEVAISDHRSAQPSYEDLAKVAAEARVGGMLGNKAGLVQLHMGGGKKGFADLFRLVEETEIPISQLLPTHVTRTPELFAQAVRFAQMGGNIDITATGKRLESRMGIGEALRHIKSTGVSMDRVTLSSDGNGSLPVFDENGALKGLTAAEIRNLLADFQRLVLEEGFSPEEMLRCITRNPAERLKISHRKGGVTPGMDADLILFSADWQIDRVYARGRLMVLDGVPVVRGTFEPE